MLIKKCRMCKSEDLELILDLGNHPPSDEFRTKEQLSNHQEFYPLQLMFCKNPDCGLSFLSFVVPPEKLYQQDYPYESSTTDTGKKHYFDFASKVVEQFKLTEKDLVVDIGSNVGVLLEGFKNKGCQVLGIDPAQNIVDKANKRGIRTICRFFNSNTANSLIAINNGFPEEVRAKVITATNVFAHVDDLDDFANGLKILLKPDGVFIFESPSLMELIKNNAYSSIYHEHLSMLSLRPVCEFFRKHGMNVFRVEAQDIHEGSLRYFVENKDTNKIEYSVLKRLEEEEKEGVNNLERLKKFAFDSEEHMDELASLLINIKREGKSIAICSMPAKFQTILNTLHLGKDIFDFATDKSSLKQGRYSPGQNFEIFSDEELLKRQPDYTVIGAWNFQREIMENNKQYLEKGGKFILLFPKIRVIEGEI